MLILIHKTCFFSFLLCSFVQANVSSQSYACTNNFGHLIGSITHWSEISRASQFKTKRKHPEASRVSILRLFVSFDFDLAQFQFIESLMFNHKEANEHFSNFLDWRCFLMIYARYLSVHPSVNCELWKTCHCARLNMYACVREWCLLQCVYWLFLPVLIACVCVWRIACVRACVLVCIYIFVYLVYACACTWMRLHVGVDGSSVHLCVYVCLHACSCKSACAFMRVVIAASRWSCAIVIPIFALIIRAHTSYLCICT